MAMQGMAQNLVSRKQFFLQETVIESTISTELKKLSGQKKNPAYQPGTITWKNADSNGDISEQIKLRLRGNYRRENCGIASIMIDFRDEEKKSKLKNLKQVKMVAPCIRGVENEQLVLKEFLIYKIYNLITEKSFRVRLMHTTFEDTNGKVKPYTQYTFLIEPTDDMVKRNDAEEVEIVKILTEQTNRDHTTLVMMFQYMVGNTDFAIPTYHNIKLMAPKENLSEKPFVVPYDFDYTGAVNAHYAVPHELLGIDKVTDRKYMGFPRTLEEIKAASTVFLNVEDEIYKVINDFPLLSNPNKREMTYFLEDFFKIIKNERDAKRIFIDNARKE
jgi:hypothetical protein